MGIGKWIGGVLGFMAFGPLGALAGIILGSFFEEGANMTGQSFGGGTNYDDEYIRRDPYAGERNSFLFSMLVMASYIIRADGKIMHSEMEYVRHFLRQHLARSRLFYKYQRKRPLCLLVINANSPIPYYYTQENMTHLSYR